MKIKHPATGKQLEVVTLDFESYFAQDYTLRSNAQCKMNTSEYIRSEHFKAQCCGFKLGAEKAFCVPGDMIKDVLATINWSNAALCCHNTSFDGLILSHHYGVVPAFYLDTLSMARALHSNEIRAGLDDVAKFYNVGNKMQDVLGKTKGIRDLPDDLLYPLMAYCQEDVRLTYDIFKLMVKDFPVDELELIDITIAAFCDPVLKIDVPRCQKELAREVAHKKAVLKKATGTDDYEKAKEYLGKNEWLAQALLDVGVTPPMKYSIKQEKMVYAFAKGDEEFVALMDDEDSDSAALVEARLAVKSSIGETRAGRLLAMQEKKEWCAPVLYNYYGAHTGRWSGGNKTNFQNFKRGGELRKCILAPKGYAIVTGDSAQIEARMNAWFWGHDEVTDAFARGDDIYCIQAEGIYGVETVKGRSDEDDERRQIGKVAILALGYQGANNAFNSMARNYGVRLPEDQVGEIVRGWRKANKPIVDGWAALQNMLKAMIAGQSGEVGVGMKLQFEPGIIWLPNGLSLKYPDLQPSFDKNGKLHEITYSARGGRVKIYGGKCLAADTEVLTDSGWQPLGLVSPTDRVFDGIAWVKHDGVVYKGDKETIDFGGVHMTPDHKVLLNGTWVEAERTSYAEATSVCSRLYGPTIWNADCLVSRKGRQENRVVSEMRLRGDDSAQLGNADKEPKQRNNTVVQKLQKSIQKARHVYLAGIRSMAINEISLRLAYAQGMEKLRWSRNQGLRALERFCSLLGGRGAYVQTGFVFGPHKQRRELRTGQLPVGNSEGAKHESARVSVDFDTKRRNAGEGRGQEVRSVLLYADVPHSEQLAEGSVADTGRRTQPVFDILNAGPHHRFVVRGTDKRPFIVSNCNENIIQALARIVVGEQIIKINRRYRTTMTTHDEGSWLAQLKQADRAAKWIEEQMSIAPDWAPGLPVASDVKWGTYYSK